MKLLVVIVCYKVPDLTIDCLRSLEPEIARIPDSRAGICENASGGGAVERIQQAIDAHSWGGWVDLVASTVNLGFCGGNNLILRSALADEDAPEYVLLLNPDTIVLDGAVTSLVEFLDAHPKVGIVGSQLLSMDLRPQSSLFRFPGVLSELDRGLQLGIVSRWLSRWRVVPEPPAAASAADWLCGASLMLRRSMLEQVGLLDEGLFTYFDDVDLCLRARRAGWESWFVPASRVVHLEGQSSGIRSSDERPAPRPAYWFRARRRFFLKHHGPVYTALADAAFLVGSALLHVRLRLQGRPNRLPRRFLRDSLRHSVFRTGFRLREVEGPTAAARE